LGFKWLGITRREVASNQILALLVRVYFIGAEVTLSLGVVRSSCGVATRDDPFRTYWRHSLMSVSRQLAMSSLSNIFGFSSFCFCFKITE
jgi:hypothetical protein